MEKISDKYKYIKNKIKFNKSLGGYVFTLPFTIGFIFFFLYPFIQAVRFSISKLRITETGFDLLSVRFENFYYILLEDPDFIRALLESVSTMLVNVPFILGFSFLAALILNQKFKGRLLARTIFFLPVIYSAGIILRMESTDYLTQIMLGGGDVGTVTFSAANIQNLLYQMNLPPAIIDYILMAVDRIPVIIRSSGIQILIFLAGLQSIPSSIYESAKVEGSSAWESFWLITLPMLSPVILVNAVYSIIDFFTSPENQLIDLIRNTAFRGAGYGASMAMALSYFLILILCLGIFFKIISRYVFYQE